MTTRHRTRASSYLRSITWDRDTGMPVGHDYIPLDQAARAACHAAITGQVAAGIPIPLTRCGEPPLGRYQAVEIRWPDQDTWPQDGEYDFPDATRPALTEEPSHA